MRSYNTHILIEMEVTCFKWKWFTQRHIIHLSTAYCVSNCPNNNICSNHDSSHSHAQTNKTVLHQVRYEYSVNRLKRRHWETYAMLIVPYHSFSFQAPSHLKKLLLQNYQQSFRSVMRTQIEHNSRTMPSLTFFTHFYSLNKVVNGRRRYHGYKLAMCSILLWQYSEMKCKPIQNKQILVVRKYNCKHRLNEIFDLFHLHFSSLTKKSIYILILRQNF